MPQRYGSPDLQGPKPELDQSASRCHCHGALNPSSCRRRGGYPEEKGRHRHFPSGWSALLRRHWRAARETGTSLGPQQPVSDGSPLSANMLPTLTSSSTSTSNSPRLYLNYINYFNHITIAIITTCPSLPSSPESQEKDQNPDSNPTALSLPISVSVSVSVSITFATASDSVCVEALWQSPTLELSECQHAG